ncbi:hypothetical protein P692DRAFT_20881829 [Suillus brevipes Sb2]|nr:hypothetical protein P692DRAFT_20881829 [Suillus brevipes Sb2]
MEEQRSDGRSSQPSDEELPFLGRWASGSFRFVVDRQMAPGEDPDTGISSKAMAILNSFVNDILGVHQYVLPQHDRHKIGVPRLVRRTKNSGQWFT